MRFSRITGLIVLASGCADGAALSSPDGSFGGEGTPMWAPTTGEDSGEPGATDAGDADGGTEEDDGGVPVNCGDGVRDSDEACDDGADNGAHRACKADCTVNVCGDGDQGPGEACDDGNADNADGCTAVCQPASCGDGYAQPGEQCDLGAGNANTGACTLACRLPKCGDGYVQASNDEQCDDGDADNSDDCLNTCAAAGCGDGFVQADVEGCDDGNTADGDGCSASCGGETRMVFVTSEQYSGDLGGLAGADAKCQALAGRAGLPGTYMAWLSDDVDSPSTRFTQGTGYYMRVDGGVIAANWADLIDGQLWVPISVTELGGPAPTVDNCPVAPGLPCVRTNTRPDGTIYTDAHCGGWMDATNKRAAYGLADEQDAWWTHGAESYGNTQCMFPTSIYCFQQ